MPHDREDRLLGPLTDVDLRFQQRPSRPLEKVEHRRVIEMPEHVAIGRINVKGDFGEFRHGALRMRESKVNQNSVGPRAATSRASANALALYVASSSIPVVARNRSAAARPA